jgi:hypothetical protein
MIRLRQGVRPTERHLPAPAPKPRRMNLKILLINVALALGFLLLLLLLLYWLSGGVDGDFGKFGAMLLDILGA